MQHIHIKPGLRGSDDGRKLQQKENIARDTVVLIDLFPVLDAAKNPSRKPELSHANESLQDDDDVCNEAQDSMRRGQARMVALVDLDNGKCSDKGTQTEDQHGEMDVGPYGLLARRRRGLENQNRLHLKQNSGSVEQLHRVSVWYDDGLLPS